MARNSAFNAPIGAPQKLTDYDESTKFVYVQNNDASNNIAIGFSIALTTLTDGLLIRPGETAPVPLDGQSGSLYVLAETGIVAGVLLVG